MVVARSVSALPRGEVTGRYLEALVMTKGRPDDAMAYAAERWRDSPQVAAAFRFRKADVPAATTADAIWAAPLAETGIAQDALLIARDISVVGAAESRMRRVPFSVPVPRQTGTGTAGGWVPEGSSMAAIAFAFDTVTLARRKTQTFSVVSEELFRFGANARPVVTDITIGGHTRRLDTLFLDPTETDPASITAGGTPVTSTGASAAQMTTDFGALIAAITTSGRGLTWIMPPKTAARVALVLGAAAADLPRTLFGLPVILSANSPQQVTLVDLAEIAYADNGEFEVSVSRQASVEMMDDPTMASAGVGSPPVGPTGTQTVSLFQTNSVGLRTTRWLAWEVIRSGAVAYMIVSY